jgi:hypothetical protein
MTKKLSIFFHCPFFQRAAVKQDHYRVKGRTLFCDTQLQFPLLCNSAVLRVCIYLRIRMKLFADAPIRIQESLSLRYW